MRRAVLASGLAIVALLANLAAAQLGTRPAEDWIARLERPERVAELKIDEVIAHLELSPGDRVADIGAGAGVFALPLARAVGPAGTVFAVEVDPGFLQHFEKRARAAALDNVVPVQGAFGDPRLPTREIDLAFFHDVLHHIEDRGGYLKTLASYLKPTGRIALIELDMEHPTTPHRDEPALLVSKAQAQRWMANAGLVPVQEFDLFDNKWFVIYGRSGRSTAAGRPDVHHAVTEAQPVAGATD